ncbi:MAG: class I SAM-dependent methyltransferase [Nitriliruptoraceae bacterium]
MTPRPVFARMFAGFVPLLDRAGLARHRRSLLAGLAGDVLEIGAGTGASFAHYPPTVRRVYAVEPEPHLRRRADKCAKDIRQQGGPSIEVLADEAEAVSLSPDSVDAAVSMLVLCSVRDLEGAVAELFRVVRPGGEVRLFEHVRASSRVLRRVQAGFDATIWPRLAGGCHTSRDPVKALMTAGFVIEGCDERRFPDIALSLPTTPHVVVLARKPLEPTMREPTVSDDAHVRSAGPIEHPGKDERS